jgi:hypothetical protein
MRDVLERVGKGRKELTNKMVYEEDKLLKDMQCLCSGWISSNKRWGGLDEICDGSRRSGVACGLIGGILLINYYAIASIS